MKFKRHQFDLSGECYLESKNYIFIIQRPISKSKTVCFVARRFRKHSSKIGTPYDNHWFMDINKDGSLVNGCSLPLTSLRTAKRRIIAAYRQRYNPKYLIEFKECSGCGSSKIIKVIYCQKCLNRYGWA